MTSGSEGLESLLAEPRPRRGFLLAASFVGLLLLALGAVLWSERGPAVFVDMLSSALALCF